MSKYALIIDDNKLVTESLKENIDWHKLDVVVTHVFYDALQIEEVVASETVDIIIYDIRMPGLSGLEMAKEVLKQNPAIKIILISAYEDFQYVQEAIRLGAYDFIEKPIDLAYLSSIIAKQRLKSIWIFRQSVSWKPVNQLWLKNSSTMCCTMRRRRQSIITETIPFFCRLQLNPIFIYVS